MSRIKYSPGLFIPGRTAGKNIFGNSMDACAVICRIQEPSRGNPSGKAPEKKSAGNGKKLIIQHYSRETGFLVTFTR
jgi:hypothetical protein